MSNKTDEDNDLSLTEMAGMGAGLVIAFIIGTSISIFCGLRFKKHLKERREQQAREAAGKEGQSLKEKGKD